MDLLNLVYKEESDIEDEICKLKDNLNDKEIKVDTIENKEMSEIFIKIYCNKDEYTDKLLSSINFEVAEMVYRLIVKNFYVNNIDDYLYDNYFFLKEDEVNEIKKLCLQNMLCTGKIKDENMVFTINRKNAILTKVVNCINENNELNIEGFLTFRMKEMAEGLVDILDKVIENYMIEREYNEFIKLLKYFVEIQESKIDELNIIITKQGNYLLKDTKGNDIADEILNDIKDNKNNVDVNMDDMLISGLITNSPKIIVIHCIENCNNQELIQTIKNVFGDRVHFCEKCNLCKNQKEILKI